jgi:hypothetical protein
MRSKPPTAAALALGAAFALAIPAIAADLPQSGTIKIHGGPQGYLSGSPSRRKVLNGIRQ